MPNKFINKSLKFIFLKEKYLIQVVESPCRLLQEIRRAFVCPFKQWAGWLDISKMAVEEKVIVAEKAVDEAKL